MKRSIKVLMGPLAFALMMIIPFGGLEQTVRGAIGLLLWMLLWWVTQPVAPAVTALLPILVAQLFGIAKTSTVLATYFNASRFSPLRCCIRSPPKLCNNYSKRRGKGQVFG